MSNYGQKCGNKAACTGRNCSDPATKILLMGGKPWWLCDSHYEELKKQSV